MPDPKPLPALMFLVCLLCGCSSAAKSAATADPQDEGRSCSRHPVRYEAAVVAEYPHPGSEFTEGLIYRDGVIYESYGPHGKGGIIKYELGETTPGAHAPVGEDVFPEGLAFDGQKLVLLTEKSRIAYYYDPETLKRIGTTPLLGVGWGLASNGFELIRSDGTDHLYFHAPGSLNGYKRRISVTENGAPSAYLNELEWIGGAIYANHWFRDQISVINPVTGVVQAAIDTSGISARENAPVAQSVINGIAYREDTGNLLLTGKNWRRIYEVRLEQSPCR